MAAPPAALATVAPVISTTGPPPLPPQRTSSWAYSVDCRMPEPASVRPMHSVHHASEPSMRVLNADLDRVVVEHSGVLMLVPSMAYGAQRPGFEVVAPAELCLPAGHHQASVGIRVLPTSTKFEEDICFVFPAHLEVAACWRCEEDVEPPTTVAASAPAGAPAAAQLKWHQVGYMMCDSHLVVTTREACTLVASTTRSSAQVVVRTYSHHESGTARLLFCHGMHQDAHLAVRDCDPGACELVACAPSIILDCDVVQHDIVEVECDGQISAVLEVDHATLPQSVEVQLVASAAQCRSHAQLTLRRRAGRWLPGDHQEEHRVELQLEGQHHEEEEELQEQPLLQQPLLQQPPLGTSSGGGIAIVRWFSVSYEVDDRNASGGGGGIVRRIWGRPAELGEVAAGGLAKVLGDSGVFAGLEYCRLLDDPDTICAAYISLPVRPGELQVQETACFIKSLCKRAEELLGRSSGIEPTVVVMPGPPQPRPPSSTPSSRPTVLAGLLRRRVDELMAQLGVEGCGKFHGDVQACADQVNIRFAPDASFDERVVELERCLFGCSPLSEVEPLPGAFGQTPLQVHAAAAQWSGASSSTAPPPQRQQLLQQQQQRRPQQCLPWATPLWPGCLHQHTSGCSSSPGVAAAARSSSGAALPSVGATSSRQPTPLPPATSLSASQAPGLEAAALPAAPLQRPAGRTRPRPRGRQERLPGTGRHWASGAGGPSTAADAAVPAGEPPSGDSGVFPPPPTDTLPKSVGAEAGRRAASSAIADTCR